MQLCGNCCLDHYCSNECKNKHNDIHSKYCNDVNGDFPSDSPFAPAVYQIKK